MSAQNPTGYLVVHVLLDDKGTCTGVEIVNEEGECVGQLLASEVTWSANAAHRNFPTLSLTFQGRAFQLVPAPAE